MPVLPESDKCGCFGVVSVQVFNERLTLAIDYLFSMLVDLKKLRKTACSTFK